MPGNTNNGGNSAKQKGRRKKARRHRAERRDATKEIRERINAKMRAEGHAGWAGSEHNFAGDLVGLLRHQGFVVSGDNDDGYAVFGGS